MLLQRPVHAETSRALDTEQNRTEQKQNRTEQDTPPPRPAVRSCAWVLVLVLGLVSGEGDAGGREVIACFVCACVYDASPSCVG